MKNIGIIIELESDSGKVKKTCFGMITLANQKNSELFALVVNADIKTLKPELESFGITNIVDIVLEPEHQHNPVIRAKAMIKAIQKFDIDAVFGLSTPTGKDLLPRMAAQFDAPLVMDCISVDLENCLAKTSQYSGKAIATIKTQGDIQIFGIKPNAVEPVKAKTSARVLKFDKPDFSTNQFQLIKTGKTDKDADIDLAEADIIIAGGRGMKNSENFTALFQCAKVLNAGAGASRVAVDEGWVPYSMQVGQTGEKVNPKVYIACGISGSIQHFAGMKTSQMVIAINSDKDAPIMSNSDYYVVADALEVIPEITKLLEKTIKI
ncbi:MAG: electron transfer flavoprotein subunit alpha/FixB family protein [Thermodesulfobacteriota bacterium]